MRAKEIHLTPSFGVTQAPFIMTRAEVTILMGPQGEGKTYAGAWAMWLHAKEYFERTGKKEFWVIARDTWENINRWTVPAILKALPFMVAPCHGGKELTGQYLHCYLLGMRDWDSLTKLQGAEVGGIWLEEPAPYMDRGNSGLAIEVYDIAISRVGRQEQSKPRLQVTMNPAHARHWTTKEFLTNPRFPSRDFPDWKLETYRIPYGENKFALDEHQRQGVKAAFARNDALAARFISGETAYVYVGERVTPEYNERLHKAGFDFEVIPGALGFMWFDGGLNPTMIVGQVSPRGHLLIMDSMVGENIGMEQLIEGWGLPLMEKYKKVKQWRAIGDPSLKNREQSSSDNAAWKVIESGLGVTFEPGPVEWSTRREALKTGLGLLIDGSPKIQISQSEEYLSEALAGGWHYAKTNAGEVLTDLPVKDRYSHPGDAASYGIAVLLGIMERQARSREARFKNMGRRSTVNRYTIGGAVVGNR
jgi:hypothetical protein